MKILLFLLVMFTIVTAGLCQTKSLQECIELAMKNNPDLQKSDYSLQQASLSTKQALSVIYPSVSISSAASNTGPILSETGDTWNRSYGGSINQQFYRPGMYSGISLARARENSSEYSDTSLRDQIRMTVERLYFQILASDTLIGVYQANIRVADEQLIKMQRMVDLGLKRQSDLLKSQVQRGTFESQLVREIEALASSKRSLNIVMGLLPNETLDIQATNVDHIDVPEYQDAYSKMLEYNPSLKSFAAKIDIQRISYKISKEAYLPTLSGSYSASQQNSMLGGPDTRNDQMSLHVSLNLFDGFSKSTSVQSSKLGLEEAELDFEAAVRDFDEALSNQYKALDTENRLIEIHQTNLVSARKDLEVVSEQYAAGFSSILDLNDAQVSVLESETNLLRDLYTRKQIESEIRRLIGN